MIFTDGYATKKAIRRRMYSIEQTCDDCIFYSEKRSKCTNFNLEQKPSGIACQHFIGE